MITLVEANNFVHVLGILHNLDTFHSLEQKSNGENKNDNTEIAATPHVWHWHVQYTLQ